MTEQFTREEFVAGWNNAASAQEAARAFGLTKSQACNLASRLRKRGYDVKRFHRGGWLKGRVLLGRRVNGAAGPAEPASLAQAIQDVQTLLEMQKRLGRGQFLRLVENLA
jgi:hypothetical protein